MKQILSLAIIFMALISPIASHAIAQDTLKKTSEANTEVKTVTLDVPGMYCATCPFTVRKSLEKLDGVIEVKTSSKTKTAIVKYDTSKVDVAALIKATTDVGYPSTIREDK